MGDDGLPFALTLITNADGERSEVVTRRKPALSSRVSTEPPDDPLYGRGPAPNEQIVFLGHLDVRGERNLLRFPADWLMRLRHNPFYDYQEARLLDWLSGPLAQNQADPRVE